jgi:hypothetical protein
MSRKELLFYNLLAPEKEIEEEIIDQNDFL